MIVIDSSVLVAIFLESDIHHVFCLSSFSGSLDQYLMPISVVHETATVLCYKSSKQQADKFLEFLKSASMFVVTEDTIRSQIGFFMNIPDRISFTDTALLLLCKDHQASLRTKDIQLIKLAHKLGIKTL